MIAIEYQELEFAQLFFFEKYVISQLKPGIVLNQVKHKVLIQAISKFYRQKPYVYIGHRVYKYNVDPMVYIDAQKLPNLVGICLVTPNKQDEDLAKFESSFYTTSFVCNHIEDGIMWALVLTARLG